MLVLVVAWSEGDWARLLPLLTNCPRIHVSDEGVIFFISSGAESYVLSDRRSLGVDESSRCSIFDLGVT